MRNFEVIPQKAGHNANNIFNDVQVMHSLESPKLAPMSNTSTTQSNISTNPEAFTITERLP